MKENAVINRERTKKETEIKKADSNLIPINNGLGFILSILNNK